MSRYRNIVVGAGRKRIERLHGPLCAQTTSFRTYRCADGTEFIVVNYPYDSRVYLKIDGGPMTLKRRFSTWGSCYSGSGDTLRFSRTVDREASRKG